MPRMLCAVGLAVLSLQWAAPTAAYGPPDHLKCYKVRQTLKLGGTADLDTPQFGVDPGCKVSKAALFCVPATQTNAAVTNKTTKEDITPLPIRSGGSGARPDDRVCYKVKCPTPATPIADQSVTDQFGNRTVSKFKASLVCTPAYKGTARFIDNGNSITDNYTGLQWAKTYNLDGSANPNDPLDADNTYTWTSTSLGTAADGTAFTNYLSALNACTSDAADTPVFAGYAGHCDWRLPTRPELLTIVDCSFGSPCIDPIFGPTQISSSSFYWSSTSSAGNPLLARGVRFSDGANAAAVKTDPFYVRAVRGGSAD